MEPKIVDNPNWAWTFNDEEAKEIRRQALRNLAVFVGVKVVVFAGIYYVSKKLTATR